MDSLGRQHQQVQDLNKLPLNQEAKQFLIQAGVDVEPSYQHLYQLLLWGLDEGGLKWPRRNWEWDYQPFLEKLSHQLDQEEAYRYLTENPETEFPEDAFLQEGDLERRDSPREAAKLLFEAFQNAMTADVNLIPSFPPETQPD